MKRKSSFGKATKAKGKLIVFEGSDGSGKATQSKLLVEFLKNHHIPTEFTSFPRYDSAWGRIVRRYLDGEFGDVEEVSPYLASMLYAGDRMAAAPTIRKWLSTGNIVVCDRYVGSNLAHQAAKIKRQSEKSKFIGWLEGLEYEENQVPQEDLVFFLDVPIEISKKLMRERKLDIHEKDLKYLQNVLAVFKMLANERKNWIRVDCVPKGRLLPPNEIHKRILSGLSGVRII